MSAHRRLQFTLYGFNPERMAQIKAAIESFFPEWAEEDRRRLVVG